MILSTLVVNNGMSMLKLIIDPDFFTCVSKVVGKNSTVAPFFIKITIFLQNYPATYLPQGSALNKAYTMLKSFLIFYHLQP